MLNKQFFTSESVTEGHPDKICDQISDAVLDAILAQDPDARVACETCCTTGMVMIMGEISTSCYVDIPSIARNVVLEIGYDRAKYGFDGTTCSVLTSIDEQSKDIALGVDHSLETKEGGEENNGAGDQGMMFGYACDETPEYMPMPISLAHRLARRLTEVRKDGTLDYLRPDGKTQVTVEYENDRPKRVDTIVISTQHSDTVSLDTIREDLKKHVIDVIVDADMMDAETKVYINPTGRFVIGGPQGDSGLTGRKIIVDTYGGMARQLSPERILPRLTAVRHMRHAMLPRILLRQVLLANVKYSLPMPSVWHSRSASLRIPLEPEFFRMKKSQKS